MAAGSMSHDLGDLLAESVRHAMRCARGKPLALSFDCQDGVSVEVDRIAMSCALHRLLCAAIDVIGGGLLVLHADARLVRAGRVWVQVRIGGSGPLAADAVIDDVLSRLRMSEVADEQAGATGRLRRAHGLCPATQGRVEFASLATAGVLLTYEHVFEGTVSAVEACGRDANAARAWVVDADEVATEALSRRLQRLGWATATFSAPSQATQRLRSMPPAHARPALVVFQESAAATADDADDLSALLPSAARCVFAVNAGSMTLRHDHAPSRAELRVGPLSPAELQQLTAALAPGADEASGLTRPAPLLLPQRPTLLVVDDNEVNRIVAAGLGESLGYTVSLACDGVDALDICFSAPPDVVLMDLAMPRMDGIEATVHLRQLQRSGAMPPFPVIAATADTTEQSRQSCFDAGMDGVLHKPLLRPTLRDELLRLLPIDR